MKRLFSAQRITDGAVVRGYYIKTPCFSYIIDANAAKNIKTSGKGQDEIAIIATRVIESTVMLIEE